MITQIRLAGEALTNTKRFCTGIRNLNFPEVDWSSSKKGAYFGRKSSDVKFVANKFGTEWVVVGDDSTDIADQREDFAEVIGRVVSSGSALLEIDKANGVDLQATVKGVDLSGDVSINEPFTATMLVEFETERPFLESQTLAQMDVFIFSGGGTPVRMPIPLDMSVGGTNEVVLAVGGNYRAFPIFRFQGPLLNPSLQNVTTGKTLNITYNLASASDVIEVDTYLRTVRFLPTNNVARQYATGDFWTLALGNNTIHLGAGSSNPYGKCTISYRDTYLGL